MSTSNGLEGPELLDGKVLWSYLKGRLAGSGFGNSGIVSQLFRTAEASPGCA